MKSLLTLGILLFGFSVNANAWIATTVNSGNWNSSSTWFLGIIPSSGDDAIILNGNTVTVTANVSCASVSVSSVISITTVNATLIVNSGVTLTVSGNITIACPLLGTCDNTLDVGAGSVSCSSLVTSNSSGNGIRSFVTIGTGTLSCSSNFLMANNTTRNKLIFSGAGLLQLTGNASTIANGQFTASSGTVEYKAAGNQNILPLSYYTLKCSGSGIKSLTANTVLAGSLLIAGTAQLDVTVTNNYSINVGRNWTVTSTHANPFIEQKGTVVFDGSSSTQIISTPLSQESFYNVSISNTAANASADLILNSDCYVAQSYSHISGKFDLHGKNLTVASVNTTGAFINCPLSGGSIITLVAGSQISFTDNNDSTYVNFTGTAIGTATYPIPLIINTGRINIENLELYGVGNFTKTFPLDDASSLGGNKYHQDVTFTAAASASRWSMGNGNGALADSFFAKAFFSANANGGVNNNFVIGANSANNYYADSVSITSTTAGGLFIGKNSGALSGKQSSHYFNGHVEVMVSNAGNIHFADGKDTLPSAVIFKNTLKLNSVPGATGDIYVGKNLTGSAVSFTSTGQLQDGAISGATNIYFYNLIQTGSLAQATSNGASTNSSIQVGSSISPCTWNGSLTLTAPNLNLSYSTFNGANNTFTMNGTVSNQSCTGGNTFAAGTTVYFDNAGTVNWYLASTAADDYNANIVFNRSSSGFLYPSYNTNCTYAGNISTGSSSDSVSFAAGASGRVTIDGNTSTSFTNNSLKGTTIKRITMNKTSGDFTLNKTIGIPAGGDLSMISGKIITNASSLLNLQDETCTVTATTASSTSYVDGPLRYDISSNGNQLIHFPIGKGNFSRPVKLNITHTATASYSYTAEVINTSADALLWSYPASVNHVSTVRWWDIERTVTSTGVSAPATNLVTSPAPIITIFYGADDNVTNTFDLTICKNTYTNTTSWTDIGATGATVTAGSVSSTSSPSAFNSFSRFTLGYYGIPSAPSGTGAARCGNGTVTIAATAIAGEAIDWYTNATGGTALATNTTTFTTPSISASTIYYAESRNTVGYVSATRTAVTATVNHSPSVSSFTPSSGVIGTVVIITGTNFTGASSVSFGGTAASSFTINSSTQISAIVAVGSTGSVSVTNGCGTGSKTGFSFIYISTWTGAINDTWTNAGNWNNGVPNNLYTAIIPNVSNVPLIISNQFVKSIIVNSSASVNIAVSNTLSVIDSFTNNGSIIGAGIVSLDGSSIQSINGAGTLSNLKLNNSSGAVIENAGTNMMNVTGRVIPNAGVLTTNDKLTLKSTASSSASIASGAAAGNYISGKIILERFVPARRAWRLFTFPVTATGAPSINDALQQGAGGNSASNPLPGFGTHITGGTIVNGFDQNAVNNPSLKVFAGGGWQAVATTNQSINTNNEYLLFIRGSRANNLSLGTGAPPDNTTLKIIGNPKQGNQNIAINGTGWQIVANPFPSVINLQNIYAGNSTLINNNFQFWDPKMGGTNNVGAFVTASYNGSSYDFVPAPSSSLSAYAQICSVFFVDAVATGNLSINESDKCTCGNDNVFRPADQLPQAKLLVNLVSANADGSKPVVDAVMAVFNDSYSNDLDKYDPSKMINMFSENLSIARNNKTLSIERRNAIAQADTIFLNIANMKVRNYQFSFNPQNFDPLSQAAFIEDSYTGIQTPVNLSSPASFDFAIANNAAMYAANRFRIIFKQITPVVLPVRFINFTARQINNNAGTKKIVLTWAVENQVNITAYTIEKSTDGIRFIMAGTVNISGNTALAANYSWMDILPNKGNNYYRIKMIEQDGRTSYSNIVREIIEQENGISLQQNPVSHNTLLLKMTGQGSGQYAVSVLDNKGRKVLKTVFLHAGNDGLKKIDLKKYTLAGMYIISIIDPLGKNTAIKCLFE